MEFKKATLQQVSSQPSATPQTEGEPIEVQINPASLRLQMANTVDAGKAYSRPNTQYQGTSSSTLSFDLVFDTADEGSTEEPVDVRTRTKQLERFLLPSSASPKAVPPRVQFTYGTLTVVGVMTTLNQDFDFFATNGVPLRAKCAVSIKEQKPEFDANLVGPGANKGAGATPPIPPNLLPPNAGLSLPQDDDRPRPPADRTGTAIEGESAPDFASRMGLDPRAWKDIAAVVPDALRLDGGLQIDFSTEATVDIGLGVEVGATAGAPPADARTPASPVPAQPPATGTALTAAGGLSRAMDRATAARVAAAATSTREAFAPAAGAQRPTTAPAVTAPPATGAASAAVTMTDPRATSFGFGVPLRERKGVVRAASTPVVHEHRRGMRHAAADGIPESDDPTVPRWLALPATASTGRASSVRSTKKGIGCRCGCGGAR